MTKQENNFKYNLICSVGTWIDNILNLDIEYWINIIYNYQKNYPISVEKSNQGGYQSKNDIHIKKPFFPLVKLLNSHIFNFTSDPNITIKEMWFNISSFTNFNAPHTHHHNKNNLSGVLYLKVPKNSGRIIFLDPLSINDPSYLTPKEKDIILFPSILPHYVEPNLSQEDRISIAFNLN